MNIAVKVPFVWTYENTARAADMWNRGDSAAMVALALGTTRCSVISKVHRTPNLFTPRNGAGRGFQPSQRSIKRREAVAISNIFDEARKEHAKPLLGLERHECKWAINDGGPFLFCAEETDGGPYCEHHTLRSVAGPTAQETAVD